MQKDNVAWAVGFRAMHFIQRTLNDLVHAGQFPIDWIDVFADFLRKVAREKIVFRNLNLPNPGRVPVGPSAVIDDDIGFSRSA